MTHRLARSLLALGLWLLGALALAQGLQPIPELRARVIDQTGTLDTAQRSALDAKLAAFGSTRRKGVRASEDAQVRGLLEVDTPVVTIYGKTSALHVREVLRCSPEENLEMIRDTVAFLKSHRREVVLHV